MGDREPSMDDAKVVREQLVMMEACAAARASKNEYTLAHAMDALPRDGSGINVPELLARVLQFLQTDKTHSDVYTARRMLALSHAIGVMNRANAPANMRHIADQFSKLSLQTRISDVVDMITANSVENSVFYMKTSAEDIADTTGFDTQSTTSNINRNQANELVAKEARIKELERQLRK